jgi:hypothetical protein
MKLKIKFNVKPFLNYLSVILLTSLFISVVLIALPLTEKVTDRTSFDLLIKDNDYWSTEFILKLNTNNPQLIEKSRDILFTRLKKFEVERARIYNIGEDEDASTLLKVVITSTQDRELVKELISNRFDVQIMTRKEDVDFFSDEDQYAYLFATNYDPTEWTREDFRNIYITELKTSTNEYSNFAIFKLWPNRQGEFTKFLEDHKGEYIGVSVDGFVTPYLVPFDDLSIFAVPITSQEELQIKAIDILYNSGVVPVNYTLEGEEDITAEIIKLDHVRVSIGLAISILLTYIYLLLIKQSTFETLRKSFLATVLTIAIYITALKLLQIPVDTFILPIVGIMAFLLIKVLVENDDSVWYIESILLVVLLIIRLLGTGYMPVLATHLITVVILSKLCLIMSEWYIHKVKEI